MLCRTLQHPRAPCLHQRTDAYEEFFSAVCCPALFRLFLVYSSAVKSCVSFYCVPECLQTLASCNYLASEKILWDRIHPTGKVWRLHILRIKVCVRSISSSLCCLFFGLDTSILGKGHEASRLEGEPSHAYDQPQLHGKYKCFQQMSSGSTFVTSIDTHRHTDRFSVLRRM